MRASHADREQVIETLKTAFADGRLDHDELGDRVAQTLSARTYAELATVIADLPVGPQTPPSRPAARPPARQGSATRVLAVAGALAPPAMFVVGAFSGVLAPILLLALPLLFIELVVVLTIVTFTLATRRKDRARAPGGLGPTRTEPARTAPPVRPPRPERGQPGAQVSRGARLAPGGAWAPATSS